MQQLSIKTLSTAKLFLIFISLKILSSILGWQLNDPWGLGFAIPILLMTTYIILGFRLKDKDLSDEKFADSCYYLGFIFTISSIIVSLIDLPHIGEKLDDIAIRFGAAMVSTVLGLIVRVCIVNIRPDLGDTMKMAEENLLEAVKRFRIHLDLALDQMRGFQSQVDDAAKASVARVENEIEKATLAYKDHLADLFQQITTDYQASLTASAEHIQAIASALSNALSDHGKMMQSSVSAYETKVIQFSDRLEKKLNAISFPDDYFTKTLSPPTHHLGNAVSDIGGQVSELSSELRSASRKIGNALNKVTEKTTQISEGIDAAQSAISKQTNLLAIIEAQIDSSQKLLAMLEKLDHGFTNALQSVHHQTQNVQVYTGEIKRVLEGQGGMQQLMERQLTMLSLLNEKFANLEATFTRMSHESNDTFRRSIEALASQTKESAEAGRRMMAALQTQWATQTLKAQPALNQEHAPLMTDETTIKIPT